MTTEQDFPATDDMIVTCGVDLKDKGTLLLHGLVYPALSVLRDQVVRTALSHKDF